MPRTTSGTRKTLFTGQANALDFTDAESNRVVVSDVAAHRVETLNHFSWSARFMLNTFDQNVLPRIIEKGSQYLCMMGNPANGKYRKLAIEVAASEDNGNGNNGISEFWGSTQLELQRVYHVVATFDGDLVGNEPTVYQGKLYLDGVAETMDTIFAWSGTLGSTSGSDIKIGNSSGLTRNWPGRLFDIRWFNVVLTPSEAAQLAAGQNVTRGLVSNWSVNDGSGSSVVDSVGGYNGTITGADWVAMSQSRPASGARASSGNRVATT